MIGTEQAYFGYEKRLEERLRELNIYLDGKWEYPSICSEAADEIKRLRAERLEYHDLNRDLEEQNAELVAALEYYASGIVGRGDIARAVLAKAKEGE